THKDIIRYFMTIPEACQLVMQAGAMAEGGEIFVLDMGDPVKIVDLAKKLIKLSGLELDKDIKIEFTGLRPGEKLYEETLIEANNISKTKYDMIFVEEPVVHDIEKLSNDLVDLKKTTEQNSKLVIVEQLQKIVPNYTPDVEHQ
ncbi:polysaccharide biosynthesis protein, partial [Finegoldia magna]